MNAPNGNRRGELRHEKESWGRLAAIGCKAKTSKGGAWRRPPSRNPPGLIKKNEIERKRSGFRGGLVFKAHRLFHHSALGLRVITKKKRRSGDLGDEVQEELPCIQTWSITCLRAEPTQDTICSSCVPKACDISYTRKRSGDLRDEVQEELRQLRHASLP